MVPDAEAGVAKKTKGSGCLSIRKSVETLTSSHCCQSRDSGADNKRSPRDLSRPCECRDS